MKAASECGTAATSNHKREMNSNRWSGTSMHEPQCGEGFRGQHTMKWERRSDTQILSQRISSAPSTCLFAAQDPHRAGSPVLGFSCCMVAANATKLIRILPPLSSAVLATTWSLAMFVSITRHATDQVDVTKVAATIHLAFGGLDHRSAVRTSACVCWASWADSLP